MLLGYGCLSEHRGACRLLKTTTCPELLHDFSTSLHVSYREFSQLLTDLNLRIEGQPLGQLDSPEAP